MLQHAELVAFIATSDIDRARGFYCDVLGLAVVEESPFALVLDANGVMVRLTPVEAPVVAPYTVLGWRVGDTTSMGATVGALAMAGVERERFDGMEQDADGVWTAPGGDRIAWFRDPDGHLLSVTGR
jgi:catechol 2,3-dioxygenase-like lactoylglutathione lyase family enzyme